MDNNENLNALWEISKAALLFARKSPDEISLPILMDLEDVLDKGRFLAGNKETEDDFARFKEIVTSMDELRSVIRTTIDSRDKEEMVEFMKERGRAMMNQFSIN